MTLAAITYRNVQHWANAHTKRYTPDSMDTEMIDYYDHQERKWKEMHHSSGPGCIYRAGPDESERRERRKQRRAGMVAAVVAGGDNGSETGDIDEDADTNKLDYNYY